MSAIARLRKFAARRQTEERCGLCGAPCEARHGHLVEAATGMVLCACPGCAAVFDHSSGPYRKVPDRVVPLDLGLSDGDWSGLGLPIGLAFLRKHPARGTVQAIYPSPLGAVESDVAPEAWEALEVRRPELRSMEAGVEALLLRRAGGVREAFIAPIDRCNALIGLIRREWRGFSGGDAVDPTVEEFFAELRARAGGRP
jgi:hypothetical protein